MAGLNIDLIFDKINKQDMQKEIPADAGGYPLSYSRKTKMIVEKQEYPDNSRSLL